MGIPPAMAEGDDEPRQHWGDVYSSLPSTSRKLPIPGRALSPQAKSPERRHFIGGQQKLYFDFEKHQEQLLACVLHCLRSSLVKNDDEIKDFYRRYPQFDAFDEGRCREKAYRAGAHIDRFELDSFRQDETKTVVCWLFKLLDTGKFSIQHCIICIIYLRKVLPSAESLDNLHIPITIWRPLLVTALLIADKMHEDHPVKNIDMASCFPVLLPSSLRELECTFFINFLGMQAFIFDNGFEKCCRELLEIKVSAENQETVDKHPYVQHRKYEIPLDEHKVKSERLTKAAPFSEVENKSQNFRNNTNEYLIQVGRRHDAYLSAGQSPRRLGVPQAHCLSSNNVLVGTQTRPPRDTNRQSTSCGSLSTTAASAVSSAVAAAAPRVRSSPPGNSANAPPTTIPNWHSQAVVGKNKAPLSAVPSPLVCPSQAHIRSNHNVYSRNAFVAASPERERADREQVQYRKQQVSPTRTANAGHTALGPNPGKGQEESSHRIGEVNKGAGCAPSLSSSTNTKAPVGAQFSPGGIGASRPLLQATSTARDHPPLASQKHQIPSAARPQSGPPGTGSNRSSLQSRGSPSSAQLGSSTNGARKPQAATKVGPSGSREGTGSAHSTPPTVQPQRSGYPSSQEAGLTSCRSHAGPVVSKPLALNRPVASRATVPVGYRPTSQVSQGFGSPTHHDPGSPLGAQGQSAVNSRSQTQMLSPQTSRGRSTSPSYLVSPPPPSSNPATARSGQQYR